MFILRVCRVIVFFNGLLFSFGNQLAFLQVYPDDIIQTHVDICDPDQGKARKQIPTPIGSIKLKTGKYEHENSNIMAKAVLAGKEVKELSLQERS